MNREYVKKSWVAEHTSALIGACGVIIAALITGIFLLSSQDKISSESNVLNENHVSFADSDISNTVSKNTQTIILNIGGNQEKLILGNQKDNDVLKPINFVKPLVDISKEDVKEEFDKKPLRQIISKESLIRKKTGSKKPVRLTIDDIHAEHSYPCSGKIDQISGVLMNHVHISPGTNSPSLTPVEGGSQIKIEDSIYRDAKGWFKIRYDSENRSHSGWIPSNYIVPYSDCKNN